MKAKEIESLQNPIIKHFSKLLKDRKYRYEKKQIVISGKNLIFELENIDILLLKMRETIPKNLKAKEIFFVTEAILKKITGVVSPEPIAAIVKMPEQDPLFSKKWILALDQISDPGNLGTLLRTALALGWEGVYLIGTCADPYNDKALRSAKGATFRLPICSGNLNDFLRWTENEKTIPYVADMEGSSLQKQKKLEKCTLILGNEAHGASEVLKKRFKKISIPIANMESLNVAISGAILMYNLKQNL